jgi:short-subunit dehydrogenase
MRWFFNRFTQAAVLGIVGSVIVARYMHQQLKYDVRNRVVLITGGSRGLGLNIARELASRGTRLAIAARDTKELKRAQQLLSEYGTEVMIVPCDVRVQADVKHLIAAVHKQYGQIDVLINCAGVVMFGPAEDMTIEDFKDTMDTHFYGALHTIYAVLPEMKTRQEGRIVNIASLGGKIAVPHLLPYSASKFALVGLSEGLSAELAKDNIVVTTVCPISMRTGSQAQTYVKGHNEAEYAIFSVMNTLPGLSVSAEYAAYEIVKALQNGETELLVGPQAKILYRLHSLIPKLSVHGLGYFNRLLPGPGGIGKKRATGTDSESFLSPSILTKLGDQAAIDNNELGVLSSE